MSIADWRYYNHAALPATAPHEVPDTSVIESGEIWRAFDKSPLLARWTTDFDCDEETNWWYVIKSGSFDISKVKAKKRYVINKGLSFFAVDLINPADHKEAIYDIYVEAVKTYPKSQQNIPQRDSFLNGINAWKDKLVFGAISKENGRLCGYAIVTPHKSYYDFTSMKSLPECEKEQVNAALVFGILDKLSDQLDSGKYICDGERNINHETGFQDYLIKYFDFRKAYARLNLAYNPRVGWIVKLSYMMRGFLNLFKNVGIVHKLLSVLQMEEIVRSQK